MFLFLSVSISALTLDSQCTTPSLPNTILITGSADKTGFLPQVQRKYWKFPLFLNFHGGKKSLEIDKDELLREEEESNPKEYSKLHCLNLHFLGMKTQKKPH